MRKYYKRSGSRLKPLIWLFFEIILYLEINLIMEYIFPEKENITFIIIFIFISFAIYRTRFYFRKKDVYDTTSSLISI